MNTVNQTIADFEQLETEIVSTARAVAAYHRELRRNMIDHELSATLTLEFARQWWAGQLGLNEQHVFMHHDEFEEGDE